MLISKLFSFEGAHVVRHCSTERCAGSIHGHSYKLEVILHATVFDHGQMVHDFNFLKQSVRELIDAFDHAMVFWNEDNPAFIASMRRHSLRTIGLPVSPSAEQLSRVFFVLIDGLLDDVPETTGEGRVRLESIILHETATGCAQCFRADAFNPDMGAIDIGNIVFSPSVLREAPSGVLARLSSDDDDALLRGCAC